MDLAPVIYIGKIHYTSSSSVMKRTPDVLRFVYHGCDDSVVQQTVNA